VANGDVGSPEEAATILEQSGADAVMIGRAHYGAPWIAGRIATTAAGADAQGIPQTPQAIADYVVSHYEDILLLYGIETGLRQARKHLGWYLDRHAPDVSAEQRKRILTSFEPAEVVAELRRALSEGAAIPGLRSAA
jgi:tRNA-dihydrouridine synthase